MNRRFLTILAVMVMIGTSGNAQAAMVSDFETNLSANPGGTWVKDAVLGAYTLTRTMETAYEGEWSAKIVHTSSTGTPGWSPKIKTTPNINKDFIFDNDIFSVAIKIGSAGVSDVGDPFFQLIPVYLDDGAGWTQSDVWLADVSVDGNPGTVDIPIDGEWHVLSWKYKTALQAAADGLTGGDLDAYEATITFAQWFLVTNTGTSTANATHYWIDAIQMSPMTMVPEPASLSLLGLACLGLLSWRRRK